jgi:hypothetical protein
MNADKLFADMKRLITDINEAQAMIAGTKARLRELTAQWVKEEGTGLAPRELPKKVPRAKPRTVNVSATVLALVAKSPGLTVPQIMDKLHLRESEAAVRSALKKSKRVVVSDKKWFPLPEAQTKKAPGSEPQGGYIPHAGE